MLKKIIGADQAVVKGHLSKKISSGQAEFYKKFEYHDNNWREWIKLNIKKLILCSEINHFGIEKRPPVNWDEGSYFSSLLENEKTSHMKELNKMFRSIFNGGKAFLSKKNPFISVLNIALFPYGLVATPGVRTHIYHSAEQIKTTIRITHKNAIFFPKINRQYHFIMACLTGKKQYPIN